MSDDDFDLEALAAYLHLDAARLARLADRGQLPGRRIGGQWRFSRAEIHHWVENRIGAGDIDELERMEEALARDVRPDDDAATSIAEMLPAEAIEVPLSARTRGSVITSLVDVAARTGWLWDTAKMVEAVRSREDLYPTALETGVALLHPRRPLASVLDRPFIAFGRTATGIPFGSRHGQLTDLFFLIASVSDRGHLHTLARLSRILARDETLASLRDAVGADDVQRVIALAEEALEAGR